MILLLTTLISQCAECDGNIFESDGRHILYIIGDRKEKNFFMDDMKKIISALDDTHKVYYFEYDSGYRPEIEKHFKIKVTSSPFFIDTNRGSYKFEKDKYSLKKVIDFFRINKEDPSIEELKKLIENIDIKIDYEKLRTILNQTNIDYKQIRLIIQESIDYERIREIVREEINNNNRTIEKLIKEELTKTNELIKKHCKDSPSAPPRRQIFYDIERKKD